MPILYSILWFVSVGCFLFSLGFLVAHYLVARKAGVRVKAARRLTLFIFFTIGAQLPSLITRFPTGSEEFMWIPKFVETAAVFADFASIGTAFSSGALVALLLDEGKRAKWAFPVWLALALTAGVLIVTTFSEA